LTAISEYETSGIPLRNGAPKAVTGLGVAAKPA
jgi:hypothetical protein